MNQWISGVGKLGRHEVVSVLFHHLLRQVDGGAHTAGGGGENKFGAQRHHDAPPFYGHAFRHYQFYFIASGGTDGGQPDAGIATGGFYNNAGGI